MVKCRNCGWEGEQEECIKGYVRGAIPDDIEPTISCPVCGNEDLVTLIDSDEPPENM